MKKPKVQAVKVPVFYTPKMAVEVGASPSAGKPKAVVEAWQREGLVEVLEPRAVELADLLRAHDRDHVLDVLRGERENGFGNRSKKVAASLVWTSGAMLSAARHAIDTRRVACAPVSGFHHAAYAYGGGFCTFNGLMVTALALYTGQRQKIGILDCDAHYGNGTDDILRRLSLGESRVVHRTAGRYFHRQEHAEAFLAVLPEWLKAMEDCEVVLYQAGADPHVDDPLGGMLTTRQMARRDSMVFEWARAKRVPLAWNLAGGYQRDAKGTIAPVLKLHLQTMKICADVFR